MDLKKLFEFIDKNEKNYISLLNEVVAIKSVSAMAANRDETIKMVHWMAEKLKAVKATVELAELGKQTIDVVSIPLPPVLLGELGKDAKKKTLLVYGHLDVQPAAKSDGWNTEPFVLTEKDGKLYGRGATDDKGPVLCWLHAINAFQTLGIEIPVNLKFCFEAMEESGSIGLDELIKKKKDTFFKNVDFVCISDNYWLGTKKPCITYGLRGLSYFSVEIECAAKDLHSGIYGGTVYEAMTDLVALLSSLLDSKGKILIPGILEGVLPKTKEEIESYKNITFDVNEYTKEIGAKKLYQQSKEDVLAARWRYPSLSIHGIEGAFCGQGAKTVIPRKVVGKFSVRTVPQQVPAKVQECVIKYLKEQFASRNSPNTMKVNVLCSGKPWIANFKDKNFMAGRNAMKNGRLLYLMANLNIYGAEPDLTREGGSIPVTLTFQEELRKSVLLLPIGASDDGAHSQNEKINRSNYINGVKVLASYFIEISK
ncbi:cytosolic non-specific dipeptidase-like isoform X1 [Leptotrombidium deliense]|uniref:Cytosolic non-specific dipeptidase-like isoform X1 n=1 Tax=Leptotrombidium deliense TaxID=299467 RepID=A0A443SN46_9ACAR|nr:cytosolic non-specific dipeptidase-like isoform X1 [Leptotrombidium deliense]